MVDILQNICIFVNQPFLPNPPLLVMENFAQRLKSARKMKGWSLQQLADSIALAITKQALHKYESGTMKPTGDVLIALSKALDVKPDYFLKESSVELPEVQFRKKAILGVKQIESIKEKVKEFLERYL